MITGYKFFMIHLLMWNEKKRKKKEENKNRLKEQQGRKEMFYLTTHSTHFIYGYMASDMVKNHSSSQSKPAAAT